MLAKKAMDHGASGVLSAMRTTIPADFHDLGEAEAYFREVLAPFGTLTDEHWCHITRHSVAWHASRERYVMLFDPQIVRAFRNPWHYSLDLWKYWTGIEVPILVPQGGKIRHAAVRPRVGDGSAKPTNTTT
jgi:hypothetical protein